MAQIKVSRQINQPPERVWKTISNLADHPTWMKDAVDLEFTTDQTSGVGTLMKVKTKIGPFRTIDILEVVGWETGHHIVVEHQGVITGRGRLATLADNKSTLVTWTETLRFPWWLGGPVAAWVVRPFLMWTWRSNLQQLDSLLSSP